MKIKYITKSGEIIIVNFPLYNLGFSKWYQDRMQYERGMLPTPNGVISVDALIRIEEVIEDE